MPGLAGTMLAGVGGPAHTKVMPLAAIINIGMNALLIDRPVPLRCPRVVSATATQELVILFQISR
jgi:hypothetical protein